MNLNQTFRIALFFALIAGLIFFAAPEPQSPTNPESQEIASADYEEEEEKGPDKHPGYYEQWFRMKANDKGEIPRGLYQKWHEHDLKMAAQRTSSGPFSDVDFIGPFETGGRTRALLVDSEDKDHLFAGGISGGLWESTNCGASWSAIDDAAANLSVSCITQNPLLPHYIYYGTGETRANSAGVPGEGIFKSFDGGATFTQLSSTLGNPDFEYVHAIEHSKNIHGAVFAGTNAGCYCSTNYGWSWTLVHSSTKKVRDIVTCPDGSVLLAIHGDGIYHSSSGTTAGSYSKVSDSDFPTSFDRIEIENSLEHPEIVYAAFEGPGYDDGIVGFLRSADGGLTWTDKALPDTKTSYGGYCMVIGVHPSNPDSVFAGGKKPELSLDGGTTWHSMDNSHSDYHAFSQHPDCPTGFFVGNDGGVWKYDWSSSAPAADDLNEGYYTTQFYGGDCAISGSKGIGGTQDNGTWKLNRYSSSDDKCGGGDGGYSYAHRQEPDEAYRATQNGNMYLITNFTDSDVSSGTKITIPSAMDSEGAAFINFYNMNLADGDQLYSRTGSGVWRTTDQGSNWDKLTGTISSTNFMGLSEETDPVMYIGGNSGRFYRVDNAATAVAGSEVDLGSSVPAVVTSDNISCIVVHPSDNGTVYVSFGDLESNPRIYKVEDGLTGSPTWTDISGTLPTSLPINSIAIDDDDPDNTIYAGTDFGLYYTCDGGGDLDQGNPHSKCGDSRNQMAEFRRQALCLHPRTRLLATL